MLKIFNQKFNGKIHFVPSFVVIPEEFSSSIAFGNIIIFQQQFSRFEAGEMFPMFPLGGAYGSDLARGHRERPPPKWKIEK